MPLDKNIIITALDYAKAELDSQNPRIGESWINYCDGKQITFSVQVNLGNNEMVTLEIKSEIVIKNAEVIE